MSKQSLRRAARARVRELTMEDRLRAGREIAGRVWELPELRAARVLLLYAALPSEVPTEEIAAEASRRGLVVGYPRCLPDTREMVLHRVDSAEAFEAGAYGLLEPRADCPVLGVEEIDVALIPGLAWDRAGRRLGRGAGYYDRLLARREWRGFRCGLFFADQEAPGVPADPWDVPMQAVVTEREVLRP